jgi:hypothetical protein
VTTPGDYSGAMSDTLDLDTSELFATSSLTPDDVSASLRGLASLLSSAAGPPLPDELAGQAAAVAVFVDHRDSARRRGRRRLVAPVALVACTVLGVVVGAAMFGRLPGPAQSVTHGVLHRVGVEVPDAVPAGDEVEPAPTGPVPSSSLPPLAAPAPSSPLAPEAVQPGRVAAPPAGASSSTVPGGQGQQSTTTTTTGPGGVAAGVSVPGASVDATIPGGLDVELPGGGGVSVGDDGIGVTVPGLGGGPSVTVSVPPLLPRPR